MSIFKWQFNITLLAFFLQTGLLIISTIKNSQKAKAKPVSSAVKQKRKKIPLRFGQFVDIWLFWHLNVNHFEMSYSIRNRWRNRASPFQTDQKHAEETWIVSSAASSLISVFVTRKCAAIQAGRTRGKWRGKSNNFAKWPGEKEGQKSTRGSVILGSIWVEVTWSWCFLRALVCGRKEH